MSLIPLAIVADTLAKVHHILRKDSFNSEFCPVPSLSYLYMTWIFKIICFTGTRGKNQVLMNDFI